MASELDIGTTFWFDLALAQSDKEELLTQTINNTDNFSNSEDALKYFRQDLAKNLNWNLKTTQVKRFIKLVERRYNN